MYSEIKHQVQEVIEWSQDIPNTDIDDLMTKWQASKQHFIDAFGGKLIYEVPDKITFHLDEQVRKNRIDEFVYQIDRYCNNMILADFVDMNRESFFENKVSHTWESMKDQIPVGMKLAKSFKFFVEDEKILDNIQTTYSRIVQEDKIEGVLCFSVHPLDYLSSSENTYNWRSCHALDGEYRAGNLSYMMDKATVVCYLRGADDIQLSAFPDSVLWNSKKWRMLLYFSNHQDIVFAGRPYPFDSDTGMDIVRKWISKIFIDKAYDSWDNTIIKNINLDNGKNITLDGKYIVLRGQPIRLDKVVQDAEDSCHFNDVLRSSFYTPKYMISENWLYMPSLENETVNVGSAVKCVRCGQDWVLGEDTMMCDDCERIYGSNDDYRYCDICGDRHYHEDMYWTNSGDCICEHCYESRAFTCERCGEVYYEDEKVIGEEGEWLCKWCHKELQEAEPEEQKQEIDDSLPF